MTLQQAVALFDKSPYAKHGHVEKYAICREGYILILKEGLIPKIGTSHYLVKADGTVCPTNPLWTRFDQNSVRKI